MDLAKTIVEGHPRLTGSLVATGSHARKTPLRSLALFAQLLFLASAHGFGKNDR